MPAWGIFLWGEGSKEDNSRQTKKDKDELQTGAAKESSQASFLLGGGPRFRAHTTEPPTDRTTLHH